MNLDLLRQSFRHLAPRLGEVSQRFYELLFARHPEVVPMFAATVPEVQRKKLEASLALCIGLAEEAEELDAMLLELGHAHAGYGAVPEQYPAVVDALVDALAEVSGPAWNAPLAAEWRAVLELVSARMIDGHAALA
jgi:hemoglobin-like flavoprotein